jgi:excisionase family DNA binding protein
VIAATLGNLNLSAVSHGYCAIVSRCLTWDRIEHMTYTDQPPTRATYTVQEAATVLGISRTTAYRLARTGHIPTIRIANRVLVPRLGLERLLDGHE